ncbi:Extracellular metalloprotease [Psilocybe cubensis]|uniref:Extracellular metalloprotease n=2 Tax=Psilocybe cubensis TaxID=181762 RepID=A0ACB8GZD1_PSICU|nr:Extracellular metalloprotease [Psilocybe cubensis]KAH9480840.1 Extracellular metalloprotease [Psilocybe cubensis]
MRFFFLSLLLASAVRAGLAQNYTNYNPCGTIVTETDISNAEVALSRLNKFPRQSTDTEYTFDVHFHIIAANMTERGGWVPQKQIDNQMTFLNDRYEGTGIRFQMVGVTRVLNRHWFETVDIGLEETAHMHRVFRRGRSTVLNVYTVGFYGAGLNGYATLPVNYRFYPKEDGVVLLYATLPGGASRERQGGTLVHEVGHWLGLRHTFQGGCTGDGDGVDDTPAQAEPHFGCPRGVDSCPGGGEDPIHNYMGYTSEACRTEFTAGQISLMHKAIEVWRRDPSI